MTIKVTEADISNTVLTLAKDNNIHKQRTME